MSDYRQNIVNRYQNSAGLLKHDASVPGVDGFKMAAHKCRYPYRHENTGDKLFGGTDCAVSQSVMASGQTTASSSTTTMKSTTRINTNPYWLADNSR